MTPLEPTDSELLTSYVVDGSEAAVGQLVRRHIGLVYSAALRQLGGDSGAAEDVAQLVFTDLARKAAELRRHGSLAGWLHTSTRFLAAKVRRSDERRLLRETTALAMNPTEDDSAAWDEIRPVLDTALHELPDNDREAVLLRFFEKLSLGEVGSRLGVGEDAARKRVDRALDKLRGLLVARGVTSASAVVIASLLIDRASAAMPAQLTGQVTVTALKAATAATTGGALAWFLGWPAKVALGIGLAAIVASIIFRPGNTKIGTTTILAERPDMGASLRTSPTVSPEAASTPDVQPGISAGQTKMLLWLVASETLQPIPNGAVELTTFAGGNFPTTTLHSDTNGYCEITYPLNVKRLELVSRIDGFADSRLRWTPEKGVFIPPTHTWRLDRPVSIGGWVVDAMDRPVVGASVAFGVSNGGMNDVLPEETYPDSFPTVTSDGTGRWTLKRMSAAALRKSYGSAVHPDFGLSGSADGAANGDALLEGTFRFVLRDGFTVTGQVADASGEPVANAQVTVGRMYQLCARGAVDASGRFSIPKCSPGEQPVTATSEGFAATTQWLEIGSNTPPVRLVLETGQTLRLRIVDPASQPIPGAQARLNPYPNPWTKSVQTTFSARAGEDGRIMWSNAPAGPLIFDIAAKGFAGKSEVELHASDNEQTIALGLRFRVIGDVWDAVTGRPIGRFKAGAASSQTNGWKNAVTVSMDGGEIYSGGHFEREFKTSPVVVRIEADGYRFYHSDTLTAARGDVHLDVRLQTIPVQKITLLAPNGRPLPRTEVLIIESNRTVQLVPGGFHPLLPYGVTPTQTDDQGQFLVPLAGEIDLLAAANETGLAMSHLSELDSERTLKMQKWGRVTGTLYRNGKPDANSVAFLGPAEDNPTLYACIIPSSYAYRAEADSKGRFEFSKAPPGEWRIQQVKETAEYGGGGGVILNSVLALIPAGGTVDVRIGEGSTTVQVSVEQNALLTDTSRYLLSAEVWTADALPPAELSQNFVGLIQWEARPENRLAQKFGRRYGTQKEGLGFTATDVLPGDYVFRVLAIPMIDYDKRTGTPATSETPAEFRSKFAGKSPVAVGEVPFTVPDPAPPEGIDLGEIRLEALKP